MSDLSKEPIEQYRTRALQNLGLIVYEYRQQAKVYLESNMLAEAQVALSEAVKYSNILKEL